VNAEVIAQVVTHGFHLLDAPPQRVNSRDTPIPYNPALWHAHRPWHQDITIAARNLAKW
jgi:pyruvate dehydrogenase E1 component beta subunit/2-oxoisovalerate dehydrogenase E1 component beta subunit